MYTFARKNHYIVLNQSGRKKRQLKINIMGTQCPFTLLFGTGRLLQQVSMFTSLGYISGTVV